MTTQEFSNTWDTLVATNPVKLDLDEYEKSVFLTEAQRQLVITLYTGNNSSNLLFENTEEARSYLSPLVVQDTQKPKVTYNIQIDENTQGIKLKDDVLFIIYESADIDNTDSECLKSTNLEVKPITHDEYHRIKNNPFRNANAHRVLRLDINLAQEGSRYVELISKYPITAYKYRYIRNPNPIILEALEGVTIDGQSDAQTSELNESLHEKILRLAIRLAYQNIQVNNQTNNQQGQ